MRLTSRTLAAIALSLSAMLLTSCSNDDPTGPGLIAPLGFSVTPTGSATAKVTFTARVEDDGGYIVERAPGATGATFVQVGTVPRPTTTGVVTFEDQGLTVQSAYRYRVAAKRGTTIGPFTAEVAITTLAFGNATKEITGDITVNRKLYADTVYTLKGFVHVTNGATLEIEAGTTIKGDFATLGSSLFVLRGAKIRALGTATAPIVFTSSQPPGQRSPGDWGGLIIVGNAPTNRAGTVDVEGTGTDNTAPPSGKNYVVAYGGGTVDADDSGELRYVRVEYAGFAPSLNNELNSFTFAAVGSSTKLSYLQAMSGLDDAFEFFGGSVSGDHLVSYEAGDDHFDMSEGYHGRLQYLIALQTLQLVPRTGAGSVAADPQGIENDGCQGSGCTNGFNSAPLTVPVVANFTFVGTGDLASAGTSGGVGMMLRRGTGGYYVNGVLARWPRAGISIRDAETYARAGSVAVPDLATADLAIRNVVVVESPAVFQTGGSSPQNSFDLTGNAIVSSGATGASVFTSLPATITDLTTSSAFDWTPQAGSPANAAGLATFSGKVAAAAGAGVAGTTYAGAAAPGGTKWWQGWTVYSRR